MPENLYSENYVSYFRFILPNPRNLLGIRVTCDSEEEGKENGAGGGKRSRESKGPGDRAGVVKPFAGCRRS